MDGFDDTSGLKAGVRGTDIRTVEDDVEILNKQRGFVSPRSRADWADAHAKDEKQKLGGLSLSSSFSQGKPPKPPVRTPLKPPVGVPPKSPVGVPPKSPVGVPPKPPVGVPPKPPVGLPPKPPVGVPPKPPVGVPPKPPVDAPPKPPVDTTAKPPTTAPTSGSKNTHSDLKREFLASFVAPVLVAYTVNELTGQRSPIHPQGSQLNADGTVTYPDGSVALTDGSVKHPDGSVTKPDGLRVYANGDTFNDTTGVYTFADGVISQAVKNSSGVWEYPDAKNPGESKGDAVAPPESSAKEPDASTTLSDPLHTYGDGDTFNKVTGVFTYKHGATVQYVRDSNGEWMLPDPQ